MTEENPLKEAKSRPAVLPDDKICASCKERKELSAFGNNPRMRLGVKSYCKDCTRTRQREWNAAHRAKTAEELKESTESSTLLG